MELSRQILCECQWLRFVLGQSRGWWVQRKPCDRETDAGVRSGLNTHTGTKRDITYLQNTLPGSPLLHPTAVTLLSSLVHAVVSAGVGHSLDVNWQDKPVTLPTFPICLHPLGCVREHSAGNTCPGARGTLSVLGQWGTRPGGERNELLSYMQHTCHCSLYSIPQCFIQSNLNVSSSGAPITFPGTLFCRLTHLTICIFPHEIQKQFSLPYDPLISLITLQHTPLSFLCLLSLTLVHLLFLCISQTGYDT